MLFISFCVNVKTVLRSINFSEMKLNEFIKPEIYREFFFTIRKKITIYTFLLCMVCF